MSRHWKYHLVLTVLQLLLQHIHPLTVPNTLNNTVNTFKENQTHSQTKPYFGKYRQLSEQDQGESDREENPRDKMNSPAGTTGNDHEIKKTWNEIKEICGYYKMCFEEEKYFGFSLMPTCCQRCSCDGSCVISNNCCPDVQLNNSEETTNGATCMTLFNVLMLSETIDETVSDADNQNANDYSLSDANYNPVKDNDNPDDDNSSSFDADDYPVPDADNPDDDNSSSSDADDYPVPDNDNPDDNLVSNTTDKLVTDADNPKNEDNNLLSDIDDNPVPDPDDKPVSHTDEYPTDTINNLEQTIAEHSSERSYDVARSESTTGWQTSTEAVITEATVDIKRHGATNMIETVDSREENYKEATDGSERHIEDISQDVTDDEKRQQKRQENYKKPTKNHAIGATTKPTLDNQKHNKETSKGTIENLQSPMIACNDISASESMIPTDKLYAKYVVISSCPPDYHNRNVIEKCERKNSPYTRDHIPVMDMINIEIYRNSYCAQCHNSGYIPMDIVTNCTRLYLLDSLPTYVKDLRELTHDCLTYVDPTTNILAESQQCKTQRTETRIIGSCNATGQWENYDSFMEDRCLTGEHMALYKDTSMRWTVTYTNIYCYLCNTRQDTSKQRTCEKHNHVNEKASKEPFESFKAYLSMTLPEHEDRSKIPQGLNRPVVMPYMGLKSCMRGYIPDKYTEQCRRYVCPLHKTQIYNLCLNRNTEVWGLVVVGKIHVQLANSSGNFKKKDQLCFNTLVTAIEQRIAFFFQVQKNDCKHVPGDTFAQIEGQNLKDLFVKFKIQNTESCSVETIVEMFAKIVDEKVVLPQEKQENNGTPELSIQMTYQTLEEESFTYKLVPQNNKNLKHEVVLNASFFCPRVVLTLSEYQKFVEDGKLETLDNHILQQEYTKDTGHVEICMTNYLQYWLENLGHHTAEGPDAKSKLEVTLSAIATVISMVSIMAVIITFCLFSELRFIPGKLALIICFNLLFAQSFFAFGMDLGVDNIWCKIIGMCIHFFWLASIFSMNSILFLMLRSFHKPLHVDNRIIIQSRSATEIHKYILHCYLIPLVCVIFTCLSKALHITEEFGYGGNMCYIRTAKLRMFTFAVPIALVMLTNFALFALIMFSLQKFMKSVNEKVHIKQIYIFFKFITMTGMYWLFGFLYEFTKIRLLSYLFIVFNAGQGFFLMWTFLHNSQVYNLYKNAIAKYIKKFKKETSKSYSLS